MLSKSSMLLHLLFLRFLSWVFLASKKILVTFAIFAIFADISGPFLGSLLSKSWFLLHLLFLRVLRYLSWVFSASKKNPFYFFNFLRYLGTFRGPSWLLFFLSLEFCYICYFCDICHGRFQLAGKFLVTFAIFAILAPDISGPFFGFFCFQVLILVRFVIFAIFAIFVSDFLT